SRVMTRSTPPFAFSASTASATRRPETDCAPEALLVMARTVVMDCFSETDDKGVPDNWRFSCRTGILSFSTKALLKEEQAMPDIEDIRCFIEVVDSGGFGRAAKRLGIAKSIVSRRIARLEAELDARLLTRTTRGISATEAGLEFKMRSERILADLAEARDAVAQHGNGIVGTLRLSVPLSFGVRYVAPVLAEMAAAHPRLGIDVAYSDRIVDLIGERFDAAIRIGYLRDSSLIARKI